MQDAEHERDTMSAESESREVVLAKPQQIVSMPAAPPPVEPQPVAPVHACPHLSQALSKARDYCKMASKDSRNEFHKFNYASADEVINTAKEALFGSGLGIIPQRQKLVVMGAGNSALYALDRTVILSHSSGEFVPLELEGWPVIPDRGRPLDKAFAVALTSSLAYLLRDLLQMPRGEESDMNTRDDGHHVPAKPAAAPKPEQPPKSVQEYAKQLEDCETEGELKTAWDAVRLDKQITFDDKAKLAKLKDERKASMTAPTGTPGDPDSDPFASGELFNRAESEREKLAATK